MSYIVRNNVKYATGGSGGGNLNIVKLTQAEYDALPDSKNSDGILYAIEDGEISSSGGSAKAITISQEDFDKLSEEEKANGIYVIPDGEDLTAKNLFYDGSETGLGNTVQDAIDNINKNFILDYSKSSVSSLKEMLQTLLEKYLPNKLYCIKSGVFNSEMSVNCQPYATCAGVRGTPTISNGSGFIQVGLYINSNSYGGGGSVFINNLIDLTGYSKLCIKLGGESGNSSMHSYYLSVTKSIVNNFNRPTFTTCGINGITELDISQLSGEYYIVFEIENNQYGSTVYINVEDIWLE